MDSGFNCINAKSYFIHKQRKETQSLVGLNWPRIIKTCISDICTYAINSFEAYIAVDRAFYLLTFKS